MAADEAILNMTGRGESPATLRLYSWQPPCLSIGYAQPISDVDLGGLKTHGWDLVRRPTGGRAILHTDELTYSVIAPHSEPRLAGGVLESYQRISFALLEALHQLGVAAESTPLRKTPTSEPSNNGIGNESSLNPVCFEVPSNYEITCMGKKLIGSAQARRKEGILQHGSLPLYGDLRRITQALVFPNQKNRIQADERLMQRAITLETALGCRINWEKAVQAFIQAFNHSLNLTLIPGDLSSQELMRTNELVKEKYTHPAWTKRI